MQQVLDYVPVQSLKSKRSSVNSIRYYLSLGANVRVINPGMNTLEIAVQNGDKDIVELLIKHGMTAVDLHRKYYRDIVKDDRMDLLKLLVSSCDKDSFMQHMHHPFEPPLFCAVRHKKYNFIRYLVQEGMDVDIKLDF